MGVEPSDARNFRDATSRVGAFDDHYDVNGFGDQFGLFRHVRALSEAIQPVKRTVGR